MTPLEGFYANVLTDIQPSIGPFFGVVGDDIMARGRMLLKRISMSEKVNKLSCDTARLLYTWMLAHLDVNGCYYADPIVVKNTIFPWREDVTKESIESYLKEMVDVGLIQFYNTKGHYLYYPDFSEKQPKINPDREGRTDIPPPTPESLKSKSGVILTQSKIKEDKVSNDHLDFFELFYKDYPKKVGRELAIKAFKSLNPTKELQKKIMDGLNAYKQVISKEKKERQHILNPASFLNQRRWEDDYGKPNKNIGRLIEGADTGGVN